jgi:hypothetical protein
MSSSLGYYDFDNASLNYTYSSMNGNTTISSKGADLAAKKGLIVFNAVGNSGGNSWHYLITPADGDSVVAVGAVTAAGVVGGFSSYGPSSDGQIKPDMASVGVAAMVQTTSNTIGTSNGTSFACPNMAGLGTILWQGFPEFNNMKIIKALQQAGSKFTTPDDRVGYGIPNMKTAFKNLLIDYATSNASINNCNATINWSSKDVSAMKYEIERKAPGETMFTKIGELLPQAGTILANHSYQFSNNLTGLGTGNISFRIKQIIDTATASFTIAYIDTATVAFTSTCSSNSTTSVSVRPNPASSLPITLVIETPYAVNDLSVVVFDATGRMILKLKDTKAVGIKRIDLPAERFAKGKYYINVLNGEKTIGTTELLKL